MRRLRLALLSASLVVCGRTEAQQVGGVDTDQMVLLRTNETFRLLTGVVLDAYFEHFRDEPDKLAVVHYYAGRLAFVQGEYNSALEHLLKSIELGASENGIVCRDWFLWLESANFVGSPADFAELDLSRVPMRHARARNLGACELPVAMQSAICSEDADESARHLRVLGWQPHVVLQRRPEADSTTRLASCPFYDPALMSAHVRLFAPDSGGVWARPAEPVRELAGTHEQVRLLRNLPENRELSLRKFLDRHHGLIRELAWLYRCRGVQLERVGEQSPAREHYLRAWAIGEALFPVSERGRVQQLDPVFLAELGDVCARLGRYDLMLRYVYSDRGLPARYELAKPIVKLARVAESVRLARSDEVLPDQLGEVLPETVSQILFEQPTLAPPASTPAVSAGAGTGVLGWVLVGGGAVLFLSAVAWRLTRPARQPVKA